jgi:hypothetical protein
LHDQGGAQGTGSPIDRNQVGVWFGCFHAGALVSCGVGMQEAEMNVQYKSDLR